MNRFAPHLVLVAVTALCSATVHTRGRGSPARSRASLVARPQGGRAVGGWAGAPEGSTGRRLRALEASKRPRCGSRTGRGIAPNGGGASASRGGEEQGRAAAGARGVHVHLVRQPVPLAEVARRTGRDDVLPGGVAALRARDHVVERQPAVAVPQRRTASCHARRARDGRSSAAPCAVRGRNGRADDVGHWNVPVASEVVDRAPRDGLPLEDEHVGAAERAHVERLVTRIEDGTCCNLAEMYERLSWPTRSVSGPWRVLRPPAPPARGRPRPGRARVPSCRSARSRPPWIAVTTTPLRAESRSASDADW